MRHAVRLSRLTVAALLAVVFPLLAASPSTGTATPAVAESMEVNGIVLHYRIVGDGEPLVLLHSGTQTGEMFGPFVEGLAASCRLIIPDLRGHGGSTNPDDAWSTRLFSADIFALLDHLEIDRFKAIGTSAGAMTLLRMAIAQPERVEAMVVVGVGTYLPSECRAALAGVSADDLSAAAWERLRQKHLHGDRDYCFPASMAQEIYEAIPDAYLWVVPNGTHVPIQGSRAGPFARNALAFLAESWEGD